MIVPEEVLRRAKIFRQQIPAQGPCPLFILPGLPDLRDNDECCWSCGTWIERRQGHYRCDLCAQALRLAFEWAARPEREDGAE